MDLDDPVALTKILDAEEIEQIPPNVQEKLTTALNGLIADYCKEKSASYRIGDYEQKTEELQNQIQDQELKLKNFEQNVTELRAQLDQVSAERAQLLEVASNHDKDVVKLRKEKNDVIEERDSLLLLIERHNSEEERMKCDIQSYQQQLNHAINAKCEAIARIDEIESKEVALQMKERRFEQELDGMRNENKVLRDDLSRHLAELQSLRRDNTLHSLQLDTRLTEKTNELKIVKGQIAQYQKTIEELNESIRVDTETRQKQREESDNIIDKYATEVQMRTKLADLYKGGIEAAKQERDELLAAVDELKGLMKEGTDMYGELETEFKAYRLNAEQTLEEKDKTINDLKQELEHANDLLKEMQQESVESAISKLAPTAAITSRLMRSDMSLTQLYSLYAKTAEELEHQKLENSKLNLHMKKILEELHEQAPIYEAQCTDYHKLNDLYKALTQENEELNKFKQELMSNLNEASSKIQYLESEHKKMERSRNDTIRQMACLIQQVEYLRVGLTPNRAASSSNESFTNSNDVISKKLVTFTNITELINNNAKLLMTVQDMSATLEGYENERDNIVETKLKEKLESYDKKIQEFQNLLEQKNVALKTALEKCERYKKMYFDQQKKMGKQVNQSELDNSTQESSMNVDSATGSTTAIDKQSKDWNDMKNKIHSLEQQLADVEEKYKVVKEEYEYYKGEKKNNDKLFQDQFDSMRTELRDLTKSNFKVTNNNEYLMEQNKVLGKNNANYKQQITALEDRIKNYESTIVKHEQTLLLLKDDVMSAHRKVAVAESESNNLRHDNRMLKDMVSRLQAEKDVYNREQHSQTLLLNNLEFIKSNLERSEAEGRIRLEQRLEETSRELAAQRRHFQEEEDSYREKLNYFKRQTETAKKRMEDEKQQADKLREELTAMREDIAAKTTQIDELSKKLQESLTPTTADNPITVANKRAREFETKYEEAKIEIDSLTNELTKAREHGDQFYTMSQNSESEIKRLHDIHVSYETNAEAKLEELKRSEESLKTRISDLEAEIMLSNVTEQSKNINLPEQLKTAQEELKNTLVKLTEANKLIRTLRTDNGTLTESLNNAETKYTNEMVQHSADIQELAKLKAELTKIRDEIKMNTCGKETSEAAFEELKKSHEELQRAFSAEKEEYTKRLNEINELNSYLHDQIDALTSKLFLLTKPNAADHSMNESGMDTSMSELNRSKLEEENKSNEQLLQIIKYLRKEKDLYACKYDISQSEYSRLQSEHTVVQKKNEELTSYVNQKRSQTESDALSASKHEEILRKIETINAVMDSNRILREERNELAARVNELKNHNNSIEEELLPLKEKNCELTSRVDELSMENTSLRTEAMKWRHRANVLVEKSNKNPEEFKRLIQERDSHAKNLALEKEAHKKALDEITTLRTKLESDMSSLNKQVQGLSEERRKLYDENLNCKQNISRITQELIDLKNTILQKEDDLQKANEEVQLKEQQLQESRSKELQIRKIAKRYKDNFVALSNRVKTELKLDPNELNSLVLDESSSNKNGELENLRSQIDDLTTTLNSKDKQLELLQKERDDHKVKADFNAQSTDLLRDCRATIVALTKKNSALEELANIKKQSNDEATLAGIKASYDEKIASLEKALQDQITLNNETTMRLTRENEALHMRINQLNRQLGLQQSAKPTTSSVAITEKGGISDSSPRTANVKPMSGSATVQQSATVTPWRGSDTTPLASIRPISMQSSRTAAILPTSQQTSAGSSSTSSTTTTSSTSASGSNASTGNTALVPPQQQVHTTGTTSIEAIASSSPTSSHTDYMPSTSSASVAVAAIPPMGAASAAESSQEAESLQQPQQNDSPIYVGGGQQQVVALVSPRVEGSSSSSSTTTSTQNTAVPCVQLSQDLNNQQQQPSTSGTSSTSSTVVSSHSRHTPSSSSVTTTQAGCSSVGHKRPRDIEGDSTNADESSNDKMVKQTKRSRSVLHGDSTSTLNMGDSGIDVDQMPTSSQRDQEDDVVVVVSEDDEDHAMVEGDDDEPMDGCDAEQEEGYDYEQDQDDDQDECPESVIEGGEIDMRDQDTNEVDIDDGPEQQSQQCTSGTENHQSMDLSESSAVAATSDTDNNQQSQAISSGSGETTSMANIPQSAAGQWKQASSSTSSSSATALRRSDNSTEIVSSPHVSKSAADNDNELKEDDAPNGSGMATESYAQNILQDEDEATSEEPKESDKGGEATGADDNVEGDEDFGEETAGTAETTEEGDDDVGQQGGSATQSEIQDNQLSQIEGTSEDNEGTDGVSSEGEKQTVEGVEEEGREAEATTSPTMNTRSKSIRSTGPGMRRGGRHTQHRGGGNNRPTPIIWQEAPGNSRSMHNLRHQQHDQQMSSQNRNFNPQRGSRGGRRTMRRPPGGNPYNPNMRFP